MFVDLAGEHIADIMSIGRSLKNISSASAILDASNFTFHAISYGKDSESFSNHGHKIIDPSSDGWIKVISYDNTSFSGYNSSSTIYHIAYNTITKPSSPDPLDSRLERRSTLPAYSNFVEDTGQCINSIINPQIYSAAHLVGCFPAASGTDFKVIDENNNLIFSSTLSSVYNGLSLIGSLGLTGVVSGYWMDSSGYLKFLEGASFGYQIHEQKYNQVTGDPTSWLDFSGVLLVSGDDFPNNFFITWPLMLGDAGSLNLFGGIYHLGLWTLDFKSMLKNGINPPFEFKTLNNPRKYKLFCKKTFNKDIFNYTGNDSFINMFCEIPSTGFDNQTGIVFKWNLRFV